jgi:hypothetical protein
MRKLTVKSSRKPKESTKMVKEKAVKVPGEKRTRKSGPRKSVIVMHEGKPMRLDSYCKLVGTKLPTAYNRIRAKFIRQGETDAMIIDSTDEVFSSERLVSNAQATVLFHNGAVVRCTLAEALDRGNYHVILCKQGVRFFDVDGVQPYVDIESYDKMPKQLENLEEPATI